MALKFSSAYRSTPTSSASFTRALHRGWRSPPTGSDRARGNSRRASSWCRRASCRRRLRRGWRQPGRPDMATIVLTPISPARRMGLFHLLTVTLAHRSQDRADWPEQVECCDLRGHGPRSPSARLLESALVGRADGRRRKCGACDQPPPVISMPSTAELHALVEAWSPVKERSPITSVQMESFMCLSFGDRLHSDFAIGIMSVGASEGTRSWGTRRVKPKSRL